MSDSWAGARRILNEWRSRPGADWPIVLLLTGLHLTVVALTGSGDLLGRPGREQRLEIYTTGATVVAVVGGFATAAIAQYAAASGRRMRALRATERLAAQLRRNWLSVLSATLLIAGVCLLAIILDVTERDPGGVHWMVEAALFLGFLRAYRLLWLFHTVIIATDRDLADPAPEPQQLPL
ncbi:hypothetical protein ACIGW3_12395 [Streptomyces sp. NPDC053499]|uniref:hypothetical protein n=1 Tax=Streptomyces sp. NPDC053499 TaxID=3365707 RepID=UPI0037CF0EAE